MSFLDTVWILPPYNFLIKIFEVHFFTKKSIQKLKSSSQPPLCFPASSGEIWKFIFPMQEIVCVKQKKWFRKQICLSHHSHFIIWNVFHLFFCRVMRGIAHHDSGAMAAHTLPYMSKVKSLFFWGGGIRIGLYVHKVLLFSEHTSLEESIKKTDCFQTPTHLFTRNFIRCFIKILRMFQHLNHVEWLSSCDHKISSNHTWLDKKVLFSKQGHSLKTL